ncbi:acyl-CoA oxidase [Aspergillus floccosus]
MPEFPDNLRPSEPNGPDTLQRERDHSHMDVSRLSSHLFDDGFLERQARVLAIIRKESLLDKTLQMNLSRQDRFKLAVARGKLIRRLQDQHKWNLDDYKMAHYLVDEPTPYHLHMQMFRTTVLEQGTPEQQAYWLPDIESWDIIGAYAQTELGHGSNVRGLELQARWEPDQKCFVLHSPTLTASKWWNGTLGRLATHAIVMAQLLSPGPNGEYISHGPQAFVVQVRDLKTHLPLDGVVIGDIGPKYGYNTMDNAYMLFNNFHIPHSALLSRYARLGPTTGEFTKPGKPAVTYGSMTNVRANLVHEARFALARAVTVAVRYTAIRRQFHDRDTTASENELPVLDYPTVQIRILPLLAATFALHYAGRAMSDSYQQTRKEIEKNDFTRLAHMHSLSSGLKSLCTTIAADGIEVCRRAMGGHGFGGASGLVQLNNDYLAKPTVEGDNWMISQQVASYMIKKMSSAVETLDTPPVDETDAQFKSFLKNRAAGAHYNILENDEDICASFRRRAAVTAYNAYKARVVEKQKWNQLLVQLHQLSQAQSQSFLVNTFYRSLQALSHPEREVVTDLFRLFALTIMRSDSFEFLRCGAASLADLDALTGKIQDLMARIRPHAVKLVDSWAIPDYLLDSALGRYDGRVYEDLFHRAHRLNPLNRYTFNPDYRNDEIVKGSKETGLDILSKL